MAFHESRPAHMPCPGSRALPAPRLPVEDTSCQVLDYKCFSVAPVKRGATCALYPARRVCLSRCRRSTAGPGARRGLPRPPLHPPARHTRRSRTCKQHLPLTRFVKAEEFAAAACRPYHSREHDIQPLEKPLTLRPSHRMGNSRQAALQRAQQQRPAADERQRRVLT